MASNEPTFTRDQRSRLKKTGLYPKQIAELERVLTPNRAWLQLPPTMSSVRDELSAFRSAIAAACGVGDKLTNPEKYTKDKIAARKEAEARLEIAANDLAEIKVLPRLSESLEGLETLHRITATALENLPKKQRRKLADFRLVERIDKALKSAFIKVHKPPLPEYTLDASSSPGSTFHQIVGICYEAAGVNDADPERAIKAYIRVQKNRKKRRLARAVIVIGEKRLDKTHQRRREEEAAKLGRQRGRKSRLVS